MQNRETDIVKTGTGSEFQVRTAVWSSRNSAFFTNSLGYNSFRFVVKTGSSVASYGARAPPPLDFQSLFSKYCVSLRD